VNRFLIIRAIKKDQGYTLQDDLGNYPTEGRLVSSRQKAYMECDAMYNNDMWHGHKVKSGYSIMID
jgi:hypothetical protein